MLVDPAPLEARALYRLMTSVVVPRPIAWVPTVSADGVLNAAPFSYFQALSSKPPMVMISVAARRGGAAKNLHAPGNVGDPYSGQDSLPIGREGKNDLLRRGMKLLGNQHEKVRRSWQLYCPKGLGGARQRRKRLRERESFQHGL